MKDSFDIQELLHHKSKHHGTKPMHPSSSKAFQRCQEHHLNHLRSMDLISANKTKQSSFIDGYSSMNPSYVKDDVLLANLKSSGLAVQISWFYFIGLATTNCPIPGCSFSLNLANGRVEKIGDI